MEIDMSEERAREVLAAILEPEHPTTAKYVRDGLDDPLLPIGEAVSAMLTFSQHPVTGGEGQIALDRSPAQFFFEVGYGACWAEAFVKSAGSPPFTLTDAIVERAWDIAGEAHDDPEEFDRYLAIANALPVDGVPADWSPEVFAARVPFDDEQGPLTPIPDGEGEEVPAQISVDDLAKLDKFISLFDAMAGLFSEDFYDDAWNLRNHLVPFKPDDEHYDPEMYAEDQPALPSEKGEGK
jgi:hypothetical protein